jgi:hypothetical protein
MIPLHKQSDQPLPNKESLAQQTLQTRKSAWKRCQFPRKSQIQTRSRFWQNPWAKHRLQQKDQPIFFTKLLALNPDPTVTFCSQLLTPLSLPHDGFQWASQIKKAPKKTHETLIHKLQNEQLRSKSPATSSNASEW